MQPLINTAFSRSFPKLDSSILLSSWRANLGCDGQTSWQPDSSGQGLGDRTLNLLSMAFSTFDLLFLEEFDSTGLSFAHLDVGRPLGNKDAGSWSFLLSCKQSKDT